MPSFTFYATAEAASCSARGRCSATSTPRPSASRPRRWRRRSRRARRRSCPCTCSATSRRCPELRELGRAGGRGRAQAAGAAYDGVKAGALGDAATFSFFPSKNLPCLGDGGAIVTDDDELAERARILRFHGSKDKRRSPRWATTRASTRCRPRCCGCCCRSSTAGPSAAARWRPPTSGSASASTRCLPRPPTGAARLPPLRGALRARAAPVGRGYYRVPVHRQPAIASPVELPGHRGGARTHLALPMGTT